MAKIYKTSFLGTTRKIPGAIATRKQPGKGPRGCLFTFYYRSKSATDPHPFIIMISPKYIARNKGTYFTGVNLNGLPPSDRSRIIEEFGNLPVGSVSYNDLKEVSKNHPSCCVRTYNARKVRALHKVEV